MEDVIHDVDADEGERVDCEHGQRYPGPERGGGVPDGPNNDRRGDNGEDLCGVRPREALDGDDEEEDAEAEGVVHRHRSVDLTEGEGDVLRPLARRKLQRGHKLRRVARQRRHDKRHEEGRDAARRREVVHRGHHRVCKEAADQRARRHERHRLGDDLLRGGRLSGVVLVLALHLLVAPRVRRPEQRLLGQRHEPARRLAVAAVRARPHPRGLPGDHPFLGNPSLESCHKLRAIDQAILVEVEVVEPVGRVLHGERLGRDRQPGEQRVELRFLDGAAAVGVKVIEQLLACRQVEGAVGLEEPAERAGELRHFPDGVHLVEVLLGRPDLLPLRLRLKQLVGAVGAEAQEAEAGADGGRDAAVVQPKERRALDAEVEDARDRHEDGALGRGLVTGHAGLFQVKWLGEGLVFHPSLLVEVAVAEEDRASPGYCKEHDSRPRKSAHAHSDLFLSSFSITQPSNDNDKCVRQGSQHGQNKTSDDSRTENPKQVLTSLRYVLGALKEKKPVGAHQEDRPA
mmetsp:Transcript_38807/g.91896  ORF Transcript_38807/g.91896 Transcript_38807/m.91896 type:complete len:514 (-) Transcript_38807:171-1712(-)